MTSLAAYCPGKHGTKTPVTTALLAIMLGGDGLHHAAVGDRGCRLGCNEQPDPGEDRRSPVLGVHADRAVAGLGMAMGSRTVADRRMIAGEAGRGNAGRVEVPHMPVAEGTGNATETDRRTAAGAAGIDRGPEERIALEAGIGPEGDIADRGPEGDTGPGGDIADRGPEEDSLRHRRRRRSTLGWTCW